MLQIPSGDTRGWSGLRHRPGHAVVPAAAYVLQWIAQAHATPSSSKWAVTARSRGVRITQSLPRCYSSHATLLQIRAFSEGCN